MFFKRNIDIFINTPLTELQWQLRGVCLSNPFLLSGAAKYYTLVLWKQVINTPVSYLCIQVMMKDWVRQPGVSQGLRSAHPPSTVKSNAARVKIRSLDLLPLAADRVILTLCLLPAVWRWNLWPPQTCLRTPAHQSSTCRPGCCSGSRCRRHQGTDRDHSDWRRNQTVDSNRTMLALRCVCLFTHSM